MSLKEQKIFSSSSTMSQSEILVKMLKIQIELKELQILYFQQQIQNPTFELSQQVQSTKFPLAEKTISVIEKADPDAKEIAVAKKNTQFNSDTSLDEGLMVRNHNGIPVTSSNFLFMKNQTS